MLKKVLFTFFIMGTVASQAQEESHFRAEIQAGGSFGGTEISFSGVSDDIDPDTGLIIGGGIWQDEVITPIISVGLTYHHTKGADYEESVGGTFGDATLAGNLNIEHEIDAVMANIMIRDNQGKLMNNSKFHPYIGGGLGIANVDADISATAAVTVGGSTFTGLGTAEDGDSNLAAQAFIGFDYDVTNNVYFGFNASYFYTDVDLFDAEVVFDNFRTMGTLGYNF